MAQDWLRLGSQREMADSIVAEAVRQSRLASRNDPTFGRPVDDVSLILAGRTHVRNLAPMVAQTTDRDAMLAARTFSSRGRSASGRKLTFGTHLTGGSFDGSSDVTVATDATNANTASTIVARDASGNFVAGIITAALAGNATTATSATTAGTVTTAAQPAITSLGNLTVLNVRNAAASGTYGVDILATSGANRSVFRAGVSGVSNGFVIDYTSATTSFIYTFTDGGIITKAPAGSTARQWKFGELIAAAVTADTTRYLSVDVNGTVYKIIVST